jgi:hypothetical protein
MGEKIKDIKEINVAGSKLMIELNEGYNHEGNLIHIQNDKFRYSLTEKDFLEFVGTILRAKAELDYLKKGDGDGND